MRYKIFGCKVNKYYADKWLRSSYLQDKSGVFVASCVVTDRAKKKWLKFVKEELALLKSGEKIYISGCGAFEKGKENERFFEIYKELESFKDKIEILQESPPDNDKRSLDEKQKLELSQKLKKLPMLYTKKFVVIQGGCDSFCTFCLSVAKRGRHFYRSAEDIVSEINDFEAQGGKEVVLTGVNLGAWGKDNTNDFKDSRLSEIIDYVLKNTRIPRIRLSSLGPEFVDDKVLKLFENKRILPHFHFSIQSGSSSILRSMRRHYDGDYIRELLKKVTRTKREDGVDISIGADIIVGFPGETESDFESTLDLVKSYRITKLHAFPFSDHSFGERVPASFYPNKVPEDVKRKRMKILLGLGNRIREEFINSQRGKVLNVLIEVTKAGNFKGWSENYIEITNKNFEVVSGVIKKNEIVTGVLR